MLKRLWDIRHGVYTRYFWRILIVRWFVVTDEWLETDRFSVVPQIRLRKEELSDRHGRSTNNKTTNEHRSNKNAIGYL